MFAAVWVTLHARELRVVSYSDFKKKKKAWKERLKVPFSVWLPGRWGPDGVRLSRRHAGSPSGWGGHPAADAVPPDPGLLGLPVLRGHRLRHLRRWHRVGLDDGRCHGTLRTLHQKERREPGHGRGGRRERRDGTHLSDQEWPWQRGFENVTYCLNDLSIGSSQCLLSFSRTVCSRREKWEEDLHWFFLSSDQCVLGRCKGHPMGGGLLSRAVVVLLSRCTGWQGSLCLAMLTSPTSAGCQPVHQELPLVFHSAVRKIGSLSHRWGFRIAWWQVPATQLTQ